MGPITGPLLAAASRPPRRTLQFLGNIPDCEDARHAPLHRRSAAQTLTLIRPPQGDGLQEYAWTSQG